MPLYKYTILEYFSTFSKNIEIKYLLQSVDAYKNGVSHKVEIVR